MSITLWNRTIINILVLKKFKKYKLFVYQYFCMQNITLLERDICCFIVLVSDKEKHRFYTRKNLQTMLKRDRAYSYSVLKAGPVTGNMFPVGAVIFRCASIS